MQTKKLLAGFVGIVVGLWLLVIIFLILPHSYFKNLLNLNNVTPAVEEPTPTPTQLSVQLSLVPTAVPTSSSPPPSPTLAPLQLVTQSVPFTVQAPLGDWADSRQQDGCEEASALMAMAWVRDEEFVNEVDALTKILALSAWQQENYGSGLDTSAHDTAERLFKNYFEYESVAVHEVTSVSQIIQELYQQQLVVTPMDGRKLGNPHFTAPGPERHMVVIIGYDPETKEFITNDPGTQHGQNYRYDENVFFEAIRDYPTGEHEPIIKTDKMMIIVTKVNQ